MMKTPKVGRRAIFTSALSGVVAVLLIVVLAQSGSAHNNPYRPYGHSVVTVSVSQSTVTAGADLGVTGSGFGSRTEVNLTLESHPAHLDHVRTDHDGNFSTSVTIPRNTTPGTHEIIATGRGSDGGRSSATVTITVQPGPHRHHHVRRGH